MKALKLPILSGDSRGFVVKLPPPGSSMRSSTSSRGSTPTRTPRAGKRPGATFRASLFHLSLHAAFSDFRGVRALGKGEGRRRGDIRRLVGRGRPHRHRGEDEVGRSPPRPGVRELPLRTAPSRPGRHRQLCPSRRDQAPPELGRGVQVERGEALARRGRGGRWQ